jgi:hypothetical protein
MIYTAQYVMFLMRADPLRGQVVGGLGPGIQDFFGPCEMASSHPLGECHLGPQTDLMTMYD